MKNLTFVCNEQDIRSFGLNSQTARVYRGLGTLMTGQGTTCMSQPDALQVLASRLHLSPCQIDESLKELANLNLLDLSQNQISACKDFPLIP